MSEQAAKPKQEEQDMLSMHALPIKTSDTCYGEFEITPELKLEVERILDACDALEALGVQARAQAGAARGRLSGLSAANRIARN
jgi:hypothetical protein